MSHIFFEPARRSELPSPTLDALMAVGPSGLRLTQERKAETSAMNKAIAFMQAIRGDREGFFSAYFPIGHSDDDRSYSFQTAVHEHFRRALDLPDLPNSDGELHSDATELFDKDGKPLFAETSVYRQIHLGDQGEITGVVYLTGESLQLWTNMLRWPDPGSIALRGSLEP